MDEGGRDAAMPHADAGVDVEAVAAAPVADPHPRHPATGRACLWSSVVRVAVASIAATALLVLLAVHVSQTQSRASGGVAPSGGQPVGVLRALSDLLAGGAPNDPLAAAGYPRVSVMVVTRNRPTFLAHALHNIEMQDYPNLEVVIIDDSEVPVVGARAEAPGTGVEGSAQPSAAAPTPDVTAAAAAAPLDASDAAAVRHGSTDDSQYAASQELLALQGRLLGDAASPEQAAAAAASRRAPPGAVRTYRYFHFSGQMSIGEKRNQASTRASGEVVITWDDDDLFRPHRISRQVEPILAGHCEITTLAHGVYMYAASQRFFNWTLSGPTERSPHFGTLAYTTRILRAGVRYPPTSFGEDYGFAERALDAGFRLRTLQNDDGTFVYVRHGKAGPDDTTTRASGNTWQISAELQQALRQNLAAIPPPTWMTSTSRAFFDALAAAGGTSQGMQARAAAETGTSPKPATPKATVGALAAAKATAADASTGAKSTKPAHPNGVLKYHLPKDIHGGHRELNWHLVKQGGVERGAAGVRRRRLARITTALLAKRRRLVINPFCMYADTYAYMYGYELGYGYAYGMYREHITGAYPECYPTVTLDASSSLDGNGIMATTRVTVVANFSSEVENFEARDLQVTGDDAGLRYGPRTLTRLSERAWRVEFEILAISGTRNVATVTMQVPAGAVYPANAASNMESVRFGPPTPRLTSDDAPTTASNLVVFVATFVDMWNFNPKPVTGMHVGAWNMEVTPPQSSVTVVLHEPAGGEWPHSWLMAVRLDPPLKPEGAVITVDVQPREGGLEPYNAAALEPVTVTIVPARAVVGATSGGQSVGDGIGVNAEDRVIVFNATVGVALTDVPTPSSSLWSFDFDKYLVGAMVESMPTLAGVGTTTLRVKVTLPAGMRRTTVVARLTGDKTLPAFVSPPTFTVTYECPVASAGVAGCRANHTVFRKQPSGGSIEVRSDTVPFFNRESGSLNYRWSLDGSLSQPGTPFTFPTSNFRLTSPTLSMTSTPAGLYALEISATAWQPAGSPMLSSTALITAQVWDVDLDYTPPAFVYAGQTFTVDWHAVLPAGASVELVLRGQNGDALFTAVVPHGADTLANSLTVSVGARTPAQTVTVEVNALAHEAFVGSNGDVTSLLTDSATLPVRTPFAARTQPWSDCSQSCGPGTKTREVVCEDTSRTPAAAVPTSYCLDAGVFMPATTSDCNDGVCPAHWWYRGEWNSCSHACGSDGTQSRTVECRSAANVKVDDETLCTDTKPITSRSCNTHPCASYMWRASAWGACDVHCGPLGSGTRSRTVFCADRDTLAVAPESACLASDEAGDKLPATEACDPAASRCDGTFYFATGPASACSAPCGGGLAMRTVTCFSGDGTAQGSFDPCLSSGLAPPSTAVPCNTGSCYSTRVGEYSDCSQTCGVGGLKTRSVACMYRGTTKVDVSECTSAGVVVPPTQVACNEQPCPDVFCVDNDCNGHGTCRSTQARCECADAWKGTYCETPPACSTGEVYDITGGCCAGTLNATGHCCVGGTIDEETGACCPPGFTALDNCGRCAQPGAIPNVILDNHGVCCAWDAVDASGECCDQGLDACMVCGGQGMCPRRQSLVLVSGSHTSVNGLQSSDAVVNLAAAIRARLLLLAGSSEALQVLGTTVNPNAGRRLADTYFDSTLTVTPDPNPAPENLDANMAGLAGLTTPGLEVVQASPPVPAPNCGNGVCEIGEACTPGSTDCCVFDCPTRRLSCPVSSNQASAAAGTCSGRGRCDTVSGTCKCNAGYAGDACDTCAVGYTRPTGNRCVSLAIINTVTGRVVDQGQVGGGGGDGSTSGDGSQAASGDGQAGEDDGVAEDLSQPEGVLLTVEEWFIIIVTIVVLVFLVACLCYLCCFSGTEGDSDGDDEEEMMKQQEMAAAWYGQYPPYGYGPPQPYPPPQLGQPPQDQQQPTSIFDANKRDVSERQVGHLEHGPSTYSQATTPQGNYSQATTPQGNNPVVSQTLAHNDPAMRRARISSASAARLDARSESQHGSVISDAPNGNADGDDDDLVTQMALQADGGGRPAPPPGLLATPAGPRGAALPPLDDPVARAALMAGGDSDDDDDGMDMRPAQPTAGQ